MGDLRCDGEAPYGSLWYIDGILMHFYDSSTGSINIPRIDCLAGEVIRVDVTDDTGGTGSEHTLCGFPRVLISSLQPPALPVSSARRPFGSSRGTLGLRDSFSSIETVHRLATGTHLRSKRVCSARARSRAIERDRDDPVHRRPAREELRWRGLPGG
jgi:hypothetical protein